MQLKRELAAIVSAMAKHLAVQRGQSTKTNGVCAYRSHDGKQCAVGCLIPDELYHPDIEGSICHVFNDAIGAGRAVEAHLMTLAPPGMLPSSLSRFLTVTQRWHDELNVDQACYLQVLAYAPVGASNEVVEGMIEKSLTKFITDSAPLEEWIA